MKKLGIGLFAVLALVVAMQSAALACGMKGGHGDKSEEKVESTA